MGRGDELEEFASAVFAEGPAAAPVVLLRGEPGIGKTTIWEYVVADAVARGRRVLKAFEALEPAGREWLADDLAALARRAAGGGNGGGGPIAIPATYLEAVAVR